MARAVAAIVAFSFVVIIVLPAVLVRGCRPVEEPGVALGPSIRVYMTREGKIVEMPLEEYLRGVVAAEMPASFPIEALKAQAVAARTFAAKRMKLFGGPGCDAHPGADICTDPSHCQAWISLQDLRQRWGYVESLIWWRKISHAVSSTAGLVATYRGALIDAAFHSACGGNTENSEDVWSAFVPYLRAKECEFCRKARPFRENKELSVSEVERRLGVSLRTTRTVTRDVGGRAVRVVTSQVVQRPIEVLANSPSGRIKTVRIGGKVLTALQLRNALGLRSSKITWQLSGETLRINSIGYGHGVGMCQYGASGMASQGRNFVDILKYYYSGVDISAIYAPSGSKAP